MARIDQLLAPFAGKGRHFSDIQSAVEALQAAYIGGGIAVVMVQLPEQELNSGEIRLAVIQYPINQVVQPSQNNQVIQPSQIQYPINQVVQPSQNNQVIQPSQIQYPINQVVQPSQNNQVIQPTEAKKEAKKNDNGTDKKTYCN